MANLVEQNDRGKRAEALLRDDLVIEAFEALEKASISAFDKASLGSPEELMMAKAQRVTALNFRRFFSTVIKTGKIADEKLRNQQK